MRSDKKHQFKIDAVNKMFDLCGVEKTYEDVKGRPDAWWEEQEWTLKEEEEWKQWFIDTGRKRRIFPTKRWAEREWNWFNLHCGPKIKKE